MQILEIQIQAGQLSCSALAWYQISAKRGTDSSFVVEANIKAL